MVENNFFSQQPFVCLLPFPSGSFTFGVFAFFYTIFSSLGRESEECIIYLVSFWHLSLVIVTIGAVDDSNGRNGNGNDVRTYVRMDWSGRTVNKS